MNDFICKKTMSRCQTLGMCSPFGGCNPEKTGMQWFDVCRALADERDTLKAEVEALRKDAERYRWLRDKQTFIWLIQDWLPKENSLTDVDAEIDAAMSKGERS